MKGLTVTSAGLLIPGVSVFAFSRTGLVPDGKGNIYPPEVLKKSIEDFELITVDWVKDPMPFAVFETTGVGLYNPQGLMKLEVVR